MLRAISREPAQIRKRTNVIISMGQSNAVGTQDLDGAGLINDTTNDSVIGIQEYTELSDTLVRDTVNRKTLATFNEGLGPEVTVARKIVDFGVSGVEIIKTAKNGSSVTAWVPGAAMNIVAMQHIRKSLASLRSYSDPRVIAYCWTQGQADAGNTSNSNAYYGNLLSLISSCNTEFGVAPWLIMRCPSWSLNPYIQTVMHAQELLGDAYGAWVDSDDTEYRSDQTHLTAAGKELVGFRMADAWLRKRT